jgi:hypothetical protein
VGASDVDMTYFRQMDPNAVDLATLQVALRSASNYARSEFFGYTEERKKF